MHTLFKLACSQCKCLQHIPAMTMCLLVCDADSTYFMHMQGYSKMLHEHQAQVEEYLQHAPQVTLLMVLPHTIDLGHLPEKSHLEAYQRVQVNEAIGIGFSRLCIQLISKLMGLSSIWLLDDNITAVGVCLLRPLYSLRASMVVSNQSHLTKS